MTEDTQPGANHEVPSDQATRMRKWHEGRNAAEAKRLKTALFGALKRTGLNLKEVAALCGFENANVLYNLKNGHSETLSIQTYLALALSLDLPMNELLGIEDPAPAAAATASSKPGAVLGQPYADAVREIAAVRFQAEMFRHAIDHGLTAMAALLQRQVVDQPPLSDPEFRPNLTHDVVIALTAMEQINQHAKALVDAIDLAMPPQQAASRT